MLLSHPADGSPALLMRACSFSLRSSTSWTNSLMLLQVSHAAVSSATDDSEAETCSCWSSASYPKLYSHSVRWPPLQNSDNALYRRCANSADKHGA